MSFQSFEEPPPAPSVPCLDEVGQIVWAGESTLLLQSWGANDDPGRFATMSLADPTPAGCRDVPQPSHQAAEATYTYFDRTGWSDGRSFLSVEGEYCEITCPDGRPEEPSRAVRVDLATGRVLEVIATPAAGRDVAAVTGGSHGVVYVTSGRGPDGDRRIYLRWPGERHGTPITGLPDDVEKVVAQP